MTELSFAARLLRALPLGLACLAGTAAAQAPRPIALVHARILTMTDAGTIEDGTVVIEDGRITAVGTDVEIPLGAREIDVAGGTVMPGLVHAWSRAGAESGSGGPELPAGIPERFRRQFRSNSRGNSKPVGAAAKTIADQIYARQDVFGELLEKGVTTLVIRPDGIGMPGQSAELDPAATTQETIAIDDDVYIAILPAKNADTAKLLKETFAKAKEVVAERKKPKAPEKPAEGEKPEEKPDDAKKDDEKKAGEQPAEGEKPAEKQGEAAKEGEKKPQPQKQPEKKKDPNIEVLADLLEGERRAFLRLNSAAAVLYYVAATKDLEDVTFPKTIVADELDAREGRLDEVLDALKAMEAIVLMEPTLETIPYTRTLVHTPKRLHDAGIRIGFVLGDSPRGIEGLWVDLMELVRSGLPADVALAGVTRVPAEALGRAEEIGSVAEGRRADLLIFDGDPLDPTSKLQTVFRAGRAVADKVTR